MTEDKIASYDDMSIYVPEFREAVRISEGDGGNLLAEDIEAGYVDYVYYDVFDELDSPADGGMILLEQPFREAYASTKDCVADVLEQRYGSRDVDYVALRF